MRNDHRKLRASRLRRRRDDIEDALVDLPAARRLAAEKGVSISVRNTRRRARQLHVMFASRGGWRVADYWPSTGTLMIAGTRHHASNLEEATARVIDALKITSNKRDSTDASRK